MNNIEVGEWGRTNLGNIIKFAWFEDENGKTYEDRVILIDLMKTHTRPFYYFEKGEHIVNHSKNIIDLIEIGDYVNGFKVDVDFLTIELVINVYYEDDDKEWQNIKDIEIKSIVTKQQFQAIEYKIGG